MRLDPSLLCGHIKTGRAIDAIAVKQRHGGHMELSASGDQVLRQGGAFQKAESRAGVEFDVQSQHSAISIQPKAPEELSADC